MSASHSESPARRRRSRRGADPVVLPIALNNVQPGADAATTAAQTFIDQLTAPGSSETVRNVFLAAGTDIAGFLAEGVSDPSSKVDLDNALLGLVNNFGLNIADTRLSANARNFVAATRDAIRDAATNGEQFSFDDFLTGSPEQARQRGHRRHARVARRWLPTSAAHWTTPPATPTRSMAPWKLLGANTSLTNLTTGATTVADVMDTVDEALQAIHDGLNSGDTASQLADILSNDDLSSTNALQALSDAAGEVKDQLDKARQAFKDAAWDAVDARPERSRGEDGAAGDHRRRSSPTSHRSPSSSPTFKTNSPAATSPR